MNEPPKPIEAEIFSLGVWNGETVTAQHLQQMVSNFHRLKETLKPPLKFGHDENQTLLGQHDGDPALGWVSGLRVEGSKLIATFSGVPELVRQAIEKGRYRRVSAEIYNNVRQGKAGLGRALKAVALLGADLPAVTNLKDLALYLTAPEGAVRELGEARVFSLAVTGGRVAPISHKEEERMESSEAKAERLELEALRAFKAGVTQERQLEEAQRRQDEAAAHQERFQTQYGQAAQFTAQQVAQGRISPAQSKMLLKELEGQTLRFAEGEGLKVSWDWVRAYIQQARPLLPAGEAAMARAPLAPALEEEDPSRLLARLASAKMVELGLSYGQAADYVLREQPELARSYRDYTMNAGG